MCEIQRAEITLVKLVQQMEFNSEIKDLSCKGMVNPQRFEQYPLLSKVELKTKLTDLKKEGIIEKVDSSEWATPVVPVVKSDGSIRLCADYSVTLNPNLIVPQHPLPRLDEIFGSLNGENNLQN
ncbi:uncharacterized protein K02A2.6 [Trichonephila clavipes]|nr:uncharacterized protein K02A2.6 [Trichonephila clavipes]